MESRQGKITLGVLKEDSIMTRTIKKVSLLLGSLVIWHGPHITGAAFIEAVNPSVDTLIAHVNERREC